MSDHAAASQAQTRRTDRGLRATTREITRDLRLGLIGAILMLVLGFWAAGRLFIEKAYVLLVFAGIWALMEGINDIARAFTVRHVHEEL